MTDDKLLAAQERIMEAVCDMCHWPYEYKAADEETMYAEKCEICPAAKRVEDVLREADKIEET